MENSVLQEKIRTYATKYDVSSVLSSLQTLKERQSVKIGFLGAFSAGKTSLINSILGLNLPTDISATTKSICMIEPTPDIEKNEYFMDDGQSLEKISISDFYSIVDGSKEGLAVIKTKPSSILPEGSVFVDTPGIDSVGTEIEQTFAYLQYVDAAVFCIKSLNGTINHNVLEFLCRPEIQSMANHIVFALTHQDEVENEEAVRSEVVRQLRNINDKLKIDNIEDKIFFVNGKDGVGNADLVYSFVKTHILNDIEHLNEKRLNQNICQIASQLKSHLEKLLTNMKLDDSEIDKRQEEIEKCIYDLEKKIESHRCRLSSLQQELQKDIYSQLSSWKTAVSIADSDQLKSQVDSMLDSLVQGIDYKVKTLLPNFDVPDNVKNSVGSEIMAAMAGIDKKKDALVMVSTAVLTAWLMPGASTAANAAEAAGGAAVKAAGNAAEKIGKEAAKQNLSQKIGDLLSKRATQQAGESAGKVGKVAENVGKMPRNKL
ncbi:dynamin family protein [Fibrobacter sp.]|uniref:dynamin family protein n=1 Tax=Fibrobacter sp. TaxID=35828 RepID=UPI00261BEE75|nr:dynamin family protein [Fibrobacter sp.]MDD5941097.1 dynamin family protein [Fibrobacter sp.]